ncbi:MAG TPA: hypothetical protein VM680_04850 [Verrucomicrobiae bacterium]|nr:hypothetical protein [Verrucomicrobiae bacterium]
MFKIVFSRFAALVATALGFVSAAQAQSALPDLVATNFGSFAVRSQTSLVNNNPGVNSSYSLVGGGNELWGTQDKGLFGFFQTNGNFDVRVRVESLQPVHRYAKSGLMVRESLSSTARMVSIFATPTGPTQLPTDNPVGEDQVEFNFRRGTGDGANNINLGSPGYPNAWLRLARRGSVVYGLVSHDGVNWTQSAAVDTASWPAGAMKPNVLLGLGASSHDDNTLVRTELRDFSQTQQVGPISIVQNPANTIGAVGSTATFGVNVNDPVDARYKWFANGIAIENGTNSTYTTPTLSSAADNTRYTVQVTGSNGSVMTSSEGRLNVVTIDPPEFPDVVFDFDDGEVPSGTSIFGTAQIDPSSGINTSGGLVLTRAANNQNGAFIVQDFSGASVDGFSLSFRLKIGPGTAKPADGFSVSFGDTIPNALLSSPQQGVGPGLAVSFDIYENEVGEAPAIDVFYGVDPSAIPQNYTGNILHKPLPLSKLVQSRYVDVIIRMNPEGKLDLLYDGEVIAYQVQTPFVPVVGGKFAFAGYAGGQNAFQGVDDIMIDTSIASGAAVVRSLSPIGGNASGQPEIVVRVLDQDTTFDTNSFRLELNGNGVTPNIEVAADTATTTLRYQVPSLLAPASINNIRFIWTDSAGTMRTNAATFTVGNYSALPIASALAVGSGNAADQGFKVRVYQIQTNLVATSAFAESVLAGERGANIADLTIADADGNFVDPTSTAMIDFDVFSPGAGFSTFPGIPGLSDSREDFVVDAQAFIELPRAGFYQMVVRSDDGFVLYSGDASNPVRLGAFEGEREPSDSVIGFSAPQPGVYPFRLVYYQAGGGASVRWSLLTPEGPVLINHPSAEGALKAFRSVAGGEVTRISISAANGSQVISWNGTGILERATSVTGPWSEVTGASNPYAVSNTGEMAFFRIKK